MRVISNTMKVALVLAVVVSAALAQDEAPWVDMYGCAICNNITAEEGLLENMTWEHNRTATGMVTVTTVKPDFTEQYGRAMQNMGVKIGEVMGGAELEICDHCVSVTGMMKDGVSVDKFTTHGGHVMAISSTDEAMIGRIHAHLEKTNSFLDAAKKVNAESEASGAKTGHEGHNH